MTTLAKELKLSVAAEACEGHPQAPEIMAVLMGEVDYNKDHRQGLEVPVDTTPEVAEIDLPEAMAFRVTTLSHWRNGFNPEGFLKHNEKHRTTRAWHGLGVFLRTGGKGRYAKPLSPSVRRKVRHRIATEGL